MLPVGTTHVDTTSDVFVTGVGSVAALDTPQLTQTKLEIRNIVAEIADLSASQLPLVDFLNSVLPRICNAMGASAAAVWQVIDQGQRQCLGHFRLPAQLLPGDGKLNDSEATLSHAKILDCVAAEGAPILVPPKSIRVAADRPANPLEECLLIVPIRIDDHYEVLLEVIQPASGGPAAQRGYLRFVAQMADLMADYLRRARLREYASHSAYVELLRSRLVAIASAQNYSLRLQQIATSLAQLLSADLVLIAVQRRFLGWSTGWRVCAVSDVATFDARSEIVLAVQSFLKADQRVGRPQSSPLSIIAALN